MTQTLATLVRRGLLIGGEEVDARSGQTLEVHNAATGAQIAEVACAGTDDIDRAVQTAKATFASGVWSQLPIHARARILQRFADGIERRMEDLYHLETINNGRPITETKAQIMRLGEWYRYNAALLFTDRDAVVPMAGPYHSYTSRFPLGVVGTLSSFNHPLMIASKSLAPALATGNCVVLKPSEQTPLTTLVLGDIAAEAGFPPGVLNVVPASGPSPAPPCASTPTWRSSRSPAGPSRAGRSPSPWPRGLQRRRWSWAARHPCWSSPTRW